MTTNELYAYYTDKNEAMEIFGNPEEMYEKMALEYGIQDVLRKAKEYDRTQKKQFADLCHECFGKGFKKSVEVSHYIVDNKLGHKYDLISGILTFNNKNVLDGGFSPACYARLCEVLGLEDKRTHAKPTKFESYRELQRKQAGYRATDLALGA